MFNPSPEYAPSRPFKIFISLLDKYEVGSPLTEALVFDSFRALKQGIQRGSDPGDDVRIGRGIQACVITYRTAANDGKHFV